MPTTSNLLKEATFEPSAHDVIGIAQLIETDEGVYLRFEVFESINGPDLHVYLFSELGISDSVELGELKANKGSFNYEVGDTETNSNVLVWCNPFGVLFSYAQLE